MLLKNLLNILFSATLSLLLSWSLIMFLNLSSAYWPFSLIYFIVVHFIMNIIYRLFYLSTDFTQMLFAGIIVKLLMAMIIVLIFYFQKILSLAFALHFVAQYIMFTIFEIKYLLPLIKLTDQTKIKKTHEK